VSTIAPTAELLRKQRTLIGSFMRSRSVVEQSDECAVTRIAKQQGPAAGNLIE
jgi:hypothetical protein